jgi:hypothetical protein
MSETEANMVGFGNGKKSAMKRPVVALLSMVFAILASATAWAQQAKGAPAEKGAPVEIGVG